MIDQIAKTVRSWFAPAAKSSRLVAEESWERFGLSWDNLLEQMGAAPSLSGDGAYRIAAVLAAVRVIAEGVAALPLKVYHRLPNGDKEPFPDHPLYRVLHDQPNGWQTSFEFRETLQAHLCLRGNAYASIGTYGGEVVSLMPLDPDRMRIEGRKNGGFVYVYARHDGGTTRYDRDEILHIRGLSSDGYYGLSPLQYMRQTLSLTSQLQDHADSLFKNGARPGVVFETDQPMRVNVAKALKEEWDRTHAGTANTGKTAIMPFGLKAKTIGMTNEDAQFLESRKFQVSEIARFFRVPPHLIGDLEKATFSNIEQQALEFVTYTLRPWLTRWEQAIKRDLITDRDVFVEFQTLDLLRGDAASRAQFYKELSYLGAMSVNDIRRAENMPPIGPAGDKRFIQSNMQELT